MSVDNLYVLVKTEMSLGEFNEKYSIVQEKPTRTSRRCKYAAIFTATGHGGRLCKKLAEEQNILQLQYNGGHCLIASQHSEMHN